VNLYVTTDNTPDTTKPAVWTASQGDASKAKTAMVAELKEAEQPHRNVAYKAVDVPTTKVDLIAFLNTHAVGGVPAVVALQRLTATA
jgi:hypothetical protein